MFRRTEALSLRRVVPAVVAAALLTPAVASADSITYIKDGNVWLANGDGSGQYQVTTDGTADVPYRSPSQADDGTIAAALRSDIVLLRQNGQVVRTIDPPALVDSVSQSVKTPGVAGLALSPDGTRIAFTYARSSCPIGASCMVRETTGVLNADGTSRGVNLTGVGNPSWVSGSRLAVFGGAGSQVNFFDEGRPGATHWFDDNETDLGDGEVSSKGSLALIRGYGADTSIRWFPAVAGLSGASLDALPAVPGDKCNGAAPGVASPTWSPDGEKLAWAEPNGIWMKPDAASGDCVSVQPTVIIPGGSEPDWGPANVNPGPRATAPVPAGGAPQAPAGPAAQSGAATAPKIAAPSSLKIKAIRKAGLRLTVTCANACTVKATATLDKAAMRRAGLKRGTKLGTVTAKGKAGAKTKLTIKPSRKVAGRLAKLRKATITVTITTKSVAGQHRVVGTIKLVR